jgi:hypothetical protein
MLSRGWADGLKEQTLKNKMFCSLVTIQLSRPGREEIITAIQSISADLDTSVSLLTKGLQVFFKAYNALPAASEGEAELSVMDVTNGSSLSVGLAAFAEGDEDDHDLSSSGMSQPLRRLNALIEALLSSIVAAAALADKASAEGAAFSSLLGALLDAFRCMNDPRLCRVLTVEYSKTLVLDMAQLCLPVAQISAIASIASSSSSSSSTAKPKKTPSKAKATTAESAAYSLSRVSADVEQVLLCLGSAKSTQLQATALAVLRQLVSLCPDTAALSIAVLGKLLSSSTVGQHMVSTVVPGAAAGDNRRGVVAEILRTLVSVIPSTSEAVTGDAAGAAAGTVTTGLMAQDILGPYCAHFPSMPPRRRHALIHMALNTLGASALASCSAVLLAHTLAAYDPETESNAKAVAAESLASGSSGGGSGGGLILISRSSQRKAQRAMRTSLPEDLFRLAFECVLTRPAEAQISTLIATVKCAHQLMDFAATGALTSPTATEEEDEGEAVAAAGIVAVNVRETRHLMLDTGKLQEYLDELVVKKAAPSSTSTSTSTSASSSSVSRSEGDRKGSAAALLLLQLEFVYEILENKTFHKQLIPLIDSEVQYNYSEKSTYDFRP